MSYYVNRKGERCVEIDIFGPSFALRPRDPKWMTSYPWEISSEAKDWIWNHVHEGIRSQDVVTRCNEEGARYKGIRFLFGCRKEAIHFKLVWG